MQQSQKRYLLSTMGLRDASASKKEEIYIGTKRIESGGCPMGTKTSPGLG